MTKGEASSDIQHSLAEALSAGALPSDIIPAAKKLLERLDAPVRVSLFGSPGSGKSRLLNLLVGADVIPEGVRLPTTQLAYADSDQATLTLSDGTNLQMASSNPQEIAAQGPLFVRIERPLPALKKISVLEVVASDDPVEQARALAWAAKRTDIALWCTADFTSAEEELWHAVPDQLKDHAFLLRTKTDLLEGDSARASLVDSLRDAASDLFIDVFPISARMALAARQAEGGVDRPQLRASGATALISAILKQVELGRQSRVDQAQILLRSSLNTSDKADQSTLAKASATPEDQSDHVEDSAPPPQDLNPGSAASADEPSREDPRPIQLTLVDVPAPVQSVTDAPQPDVAVEDAAQSEPEPNNTETDAEPAIVTLVTEKPTVGEDALPPEARAMFETAIAQLTDHATSLQAEPDLMASGVLARSIETLERISDEMSLSGPKRTHALTQIRDMSLDAADLALLLQIEESDSAAIEVTSLMIQLKRSISAHLAN